MRRGIQIGLLAFFGAIALAAVATAPPGLVNEAVAPQINGDLDAWLAASENAAGLSAQLIPETEKRIRWFDGQRGSRTRYSLVYLHGFSATRQEIAPVGEWVAERLGANLFETRLRGHGQVHNALAGVRAEDWLDDAAEALAIGAAIGEEIVLMGTSTGATLALAMTGHPSFDHVGYLVLISPNFAPRDPSAEFLTWPGGPQLAYMVAGDTRSWTPRNELQARYWSTTYPMDAVIEMMRLVKYVRGQLPMQLAQPLLVIYSPADQVVDTARIAQAFEKMDSPRRELIEIADSGDPSNHVLAGSIMSPDTTAAVADSIIRFIEGKASITPAPPVTPQAQPGR
jgi:esterase/lipase